MIRGVLGEELSSSLVTSFMCMVMATSINASDPGTFQSNLNKLLVANKLPKFNMGNVSPPTSIALTTDFAPNPATISQANTDRAEPLANVEGEPSHCHVYRRRASPTVTSENFTSLLDVGTVIIEHNCGEGKDNCFKKLIDPLNIESLVIDRVTELKAGEFDNKKKYLQGQPPTRKYLRVKLASASQGESSLLAQK
jgi:hypothetical protein